MRRILIIICLISCVHSNHTSTIKLNGSKSYDIDGHIVSYAWRQIDGLKGVIENNTDSITFATVKGKGLFAWELTVKDNEGDIHKDTVKIIIR